MQDDVYRPPEANVVRPSEPGEFVLASRWRRLFGSMLDGIIILFVTAPLMFSSGYWERAVEQSLQATEPVYWSFAVFVIYALFNGYTLHTRGQTLGKMALGTQIVTHNEHQLLALWKVLFVRWLPISVLSSIPVAGGFVGLINALLIFKADKRCGHDHIAGTIVINYVKPEDLPTGAGH